MVRHYVWLLDRVGNDGLKLTSVGYLRPVDVEAAFVELQVSDRWIGKGNREDHTVPVRDLRTSAQALGLVRKHRGSLQRTAQGRMLRDDPLRLWWHIVGRFPLGKRDSIEEHASIVSLLGVAAGRDVRSVDFERVLDGVLGALGWRTETGAPLEPGAGTSAASATNRLLGHSMFRGREVVLKFGDPDVEWPPVCPRDPSAGVARRGHASGRRRCSWRPTSYACRSQSQNSASTSSGTVSRKACRTLRGEYSSIRRNRSLSIRCGRTR